MLMHWSKLKAKKVALLTLALISASACTKTKSGKFETPADKKIEQAVIVADQSGKKLLDVKLTVREDGLLLQVTQAPEGAKLECTLNNKPINPCHDNALYPRPIPGDYRLSVVAVRNNEIVAMGESPQITILPGNEPSATISDYDLGSRLALIVDSSEFRNGMTLPLSKDLVVPFKLARTPPCESPVIQCRYDTRVSAFWTDCDKGTSYTVPKSIMATGLQYLSVQAKCGDNFGPILELFWYGVPENYLPLMLRFETDKKGRYFIDLVKEDDCPRGERVYLCAAPGGSDFSSCKEGNILQNPKTGSQIKLSCSGKLGPVLTLP